MTKNRITTLLIVATFLIILTVLIIYLLGGAGKKKTEIKWNIMGQELSINMEEDLVDHKTLLNKLFSEDFSKSGAKEWLKKNQNLYELTDPEVVKQIASLDYDAIVAKELREMSIKRIGPWDYQFDTVQIGIPEVADQPVAGYASVCENGSYFNKRLKVYSLDQTKSIVVIASGRYACPKNGLFPDIQLNAVDAERLLGSSKFSKYQSGMALILYD
jgi:hypothetical protein